MADMEETAGKEPGESSYNFPYEMAAMHGEEMPKGLSLPDQILYMGLRWLYASYRMKLIPLDRARKEKNGLIRQCNYFRFREQLSSQWAESIRKTEEARTAYRKERTLENADRLLAAVEGR